MPVGSPLEVYTTALGWHLFNQLWTVLTATGLAVIPFFVIIGRAMMDARTEAQTTDVGVRAFRTAEAEVYLAFTVLLLFAAPNINLNMNKITYTPPACNAAGEVKKAGGKTFGKTGTTYDQTTGRRVQAALDGNNPKVPMLWWLIGHYGRALPEAARHSLPCAPDLRLVDTAIENSRITDPRLRDELTMFQRDCWRPARHRFDRDKPPYTIKHPERRWRKPPRSSLPEAQQIQADTGWVGSRFFLDTDGYYNLDRAAEPLKGFPYREDRDSTEIDPVLTPGAGMPWCTEWWQDAQHGLRGRLLAFIEADLKAVLGAELHHHLVDYTNSSDRRVTFIHLIWGRDEALLYLALRRDDGLQRQALTNAYPRDNSAADSVKAGLKGLLATGGLAWEAPKMYTMIHVIKNAAPIIQALVLLLLTAVLPLLLVVSLYSVKTTLTLVLSYMSIQFWSFLFALADWVDRELLAALRDLGSGGSIPLLVDYITGTLYLIFPVMFTALMGMAGARVGDALAVSAGRQAGTASAAGGKVSGKVADTAVGAGMSKIKK